MTEEKTFVYIKINYRKQVSEIRKIGKIFRWFIGIFIILMACVGVTEKDTITGILWGLIGLLILPAVSKKIPQFKGRKTVMIMSCICLFVAGTMALPEQGQVLETDQIEQNKEMELETDKVDDESQNKETESETNKVDDENEKIEEINEEKLGSELKISDGDTDKETETNMPNKAGLAYSEEAIQDSLKEYSYNENPYYLEGLQRYVDGFNEMYVDMNAEQEVKILLLEDVLKQADVSRNMRRKILSLEGDNILTNADCKRMDEKEDKTLFSILVYSKGSYLEVSSKAKDDIGEYDEELPVYYFGELKDNKPDGEGALFKVTDAGTILMYAGNFKEGRMHGKGVQFKSDSLYPDMASLVMEQGNYEDGSKDGKCVVYNCDEMVNLYQMYKGNWIDYENEYYSAYNHDEKNRVLSYLFENDTTAELMYITSYYDAKDYNEYFTIRVNYPVIVPAIIYEGGYKNDFYSGEGIQYGNFGTLWYQGKYKEGHYHGEGILYYALTGSVQYDGEYRLGKMDGNGVLYNEDGTVRKKGEFEGEEEDYENQMAQLSGIYDLINDKFNEVGLQKFFEKDKMISKNDHTDKADSLEYIFADSDKRLLDDKELEECDSDTLSLARNEIYARHGRRFNDQVIQAYFDSKTLYKGTVLPEDFDEDVLNEYEKTNINKIAMYE